MPRQDLYKLFKKSDNFVFLDNQKIDAGNKQSLLFVNPKHIITTAKLSEVNSCLGRIDEFRRGKFYLAGFLSYELGETFEDKLMPLREYGFPLLWFGVYKKPIIIKGRVSYSPVRSNYYLKDITCPIERGDYEKIINLIKRFIAEGQTYQINYTFKIKFKVLGSLVDLYFSLRENQKTSYSALIKFGGNSILSFSPELFFRKAGCDIFTKPMKGTFPRGKDYAGDKLNVQSLKESAKDRSENIMIVDLLRNDLGRIARVGSVAVNSLFEVEKLETLLQMTSMVKARVNKNIAFKDLIEHIFPSGSVTGAPKIRAMEIIKSLEKEPRNIYTGSIGYIAPNNDSCFNVAIRTILNDKKNVNAEMGVGSGVLYDSCADKEYDECLLKASFLKRSEDNDFSLIETILFDRLKGWFLLNLHLERLQESAEYFGFNFDKAKLTAGLEGLKKSFRKARRPFNYRLRVLLSKDGKFDLEYSRLEDIAGKVNYVKFAIGAVDSDNIFLRHKTTRRKFYDTQYALAKSHNLFDYIYKNERNEVTESSIANIFIKRKDVYLTPPEDSGLLNGVFRQYLLENQFLSHKAKEEILYPKDLLKADDIFLVNSVRKIIKVKLLT